MATSSLKRGRSWLEIGVVGCSLLFCPGQAGTMETTKVSVKAAGATLVHQQSAVVEGGIPSPRNDGLARLLPRRLHNEVMLHAAVGAWSECSTETCTQSRPVMCETKNFEIVPAEVCGDLLPEAVRACVSDDETLACRPVDDGTRSAGNGSSGSTHASRTPSEGGQSRLHAGLSRPVAGGAVDRPATGDADSSRREQGHGEEGLGGSGARGRWTTPPGAVTVHNKEEEGWSGGSAGSKSRPTKVAGSGESENLVAGGQDQRRDPSAAEGEAIVLAPEQAKSGNSRNASPSEGKPNFAAQEVNRVGSGSAVGGSNDRFWTVIVVGAGAVGSFLAVAVFAFQQYRKEQLRHRGIMALNEFPQDNYINPFARELSEDDRTAFKL